MGKYHPHGDLSLYDALVRLAQDFSLRYPLVDGQGNFGSVDGDPPAAMRYTEARMTAIAAELLADIDKDTVDFVENYDGTRMQPSVLPAKLPNLLINGSAGIAVGMATNIPPHHLGEVARATQALIDDPDLTNDQLCEIRARAPTSRPGATIFRYDERRNPLTGQKERVDAIRDLYAHGRGRVVMQAQCAFEETRQDRMAIVVTELPYQVNKAALVEKIADLVHGQEDRGHRRPARRVRPRRHAPGHRVQARRQPALGAQQPLQAHAAPAGLQRQHGGARRRAAADAAAQGDPPAPHRLAPRGRPPAHRVRPPEGARSRPHPRGPQDRPRQPGRGHPDDPRVGRRRERARQPHRRASRSREIQANAILEMQLRRLAALERKKIEDEYLAVIQLIAELEDILANPRPRAARSSATSWATSRSGTRARAAPASPTTPTRELSDEDLIADEDVVVTVSGRGYIKRQPLVTYRRQARGGKGIIGARTVEEDAVAHLLVANTHDWALFFTNRGRVFSSKVHQVPDASRQAKGIPIINLEGVQVEAGERVLAVITLPDFEKGHNLVMATRKGIIKKTPVEQFERVRSTGIRAITVRRGRRPRVGRRLVRRRRHRAGDGPGQASRASTRPRSGRWAVTRPASSASGSRAAGDQVVGMGVVRPDADILVLTETGYGKRVALE